MYNEFIMSWRIINENKERIKKKLFQEGNLKKN